MTITFKPAAAAAAILVSVLATVASAAQPQRLTVDCARGQTISHALEQGDARKPLVLTVRGTCTEFVTITRDDVTLQGDPGTGATVNAPDTVTSTITVRATRVVIDQLIVEGGRNGIAVTGGPEVTISNSVIENAAQNGIILLSSSARINNNMIQGAGTNGVLLFAASYIQANGNTIRSSGTYGIALNAGSQGTIITNTITENGTNPNLPPLFRGGVSVSFSQADIGNSSITANSGRGIVVTGVLNLANSTVSGNDLDGVVVFLGARLNLTGSTISSNNGNGVNLTANSTGQVSGATIDNNAQSGIVLLGGSTLWLAPPVSTANGPGFGLDCIDAESSVNDTSLLIGSVSPNCTGF